MSSRPILAPFQVITNGSMAGNLTSKPTIIQNTSMPSYGLSWTSSSIDGAVSVQVSNDYSQNAGGGTLNAGTWNTIPLQYNGATVTSIPITVDNSNGFIDVPIIGAYSIRLVYTSTSGTGSLTVTLSGKVS